MALWKETPAPAAVKPVPTPPLQPERAHAERPEPQAPLDPASAAAPRRPAIPGIPTPAPEPAAAASPSPTPRVEGGESVIAANISIEGKIEGTGNVRIAGRFKGDVRIDGNFSIEQGAHLTGQVLAAIVVVGGELQGNIESAKARGRARGRGHRRGRQGRFDHGGGRVAHARSRRIRLGRETRR